MSAARRLFVYGSLRREAGHELGRALYARARSLGAGRVEGHLLDLGPYPGMVDDAGCEHWVQGELLELPSPPSVDHEGLWAALDRYEEVSPPPPQSPEYERVLVLVAHADGDLEAWAYRYLGPVEGRPVVQSGDWLRR